MRRRHGWIGACRATSAVVHRSFLSTSSRALHHPAPAGRQRKTHRSPRARIVAAGRAETGKSRPGKRPARHGFRSRRGSGRTQCRSGGDGDGDGDGNVRDNVPPDARPGPPGEESRPRGRSACSPRARPRVYPVTSTSATPVRASLSGVRAHASAAPGTRRRGKMSPIRSSSSSRVDLCCLALFRRLPLAFSLIKQLFCLVKELRLLLS